jgi:hypothetical protein
MCVLDVDDVGAELVQHLGHRRVGKGCQVEVVPQVQRGDGLHGDAVDAVALGDQPFGRRQRHDIVPRARQSFRQANHEDGLAVVFTIITLSNEENAHSCVGMFAYGTVARPACMMR